MKVSDCQSVVKIKRELLDWEIRLARIEQTDSLIISTNAHNLICQVKVEPSPVQEILSGMGSVKDIIIPLIVVKISQVKKRLAAFGLDPEEE